MLRVPKEMREALLRNDSAVDAFLEKMMEGDAIRFFIAARMRAYGAKSPREYLLMEREYTMKRLAEKIECPTLVCDNGADAIAGGQAKQLYDALSCPKEYVVFTAEEGADGPAKAERRSTSTASPTTGWIRRWPRRHRGCTCWLAAGSSSEPKSV